jgi:hypothetical protein
MAGAGKSELASKYARKYRHDYQGGLCWVYCRDIERNIQNQIVTFASNYLGINAEGADDKAKLDYCLRNVD